MRLCVHTKQRHVMALDYMVETLIFVAHESNKDRKKLRDRVKIKQRGGRRRQEDV